MTCRGGALEQSAAREVAHGVLVLSNHSARKPNEADTAAQVVLLLRVEDLIRFELAALGKDMALDRDTCVRAFRERIEQFLDVLKRVK